MRSPSGRRWPRLLNRPCAVAPGRCIAAQTCEETRLFAGPGSYSLPGQGLLYSAGDPTERVRTAMQRKSRYCCTR